MKAATCFRGHSMTIRANVAEYGTWRGCRACLAIRQREYRLRVLAARGGKPQIHHCDYCGARGHTMPRCSARDRLVDVCPNIDRDAAGKPLRIYL